MSRHVRSLLVLIPLVLALVLGPSGAAAAAIPPAQAAHAAQVHVSLHAGSTALHGMYAAAGIGTQDPITGGSGGGH